MKLISALLVFLPALLLAPLAQAQFIPGAQPGGPKSSQPQMIDRIVAEVEGNVILQSALDQAVATVKRQYASDPQKLPPDKVLRRQVLNQLILMQLQVQHAEQQGIRVSQDEVSNAISNIASNNHMTPQQLQRAVAANGGNFNAFARNVAEQILVQKLRNQVVKKKVQVTDAEVNNLLKSPAFDAAEVRLAHIQIPLPNGASPSDIAAAHAKAEKVEKALKGGMDFNTAAIRYSGAQDALKGGDVGWRSISEISPQSFAALVGNMKVGEVTAPLRAADGFEILKLLGRRKADRDVVAQYHARQILITPSALVSSSQAQQQAEDIYQQITQKDKDFATLAKAKSDDDTSARLGGDLGWFKLQAHGPDVANVLASLKKGQVSQPFQTPSGWDIIQLLGTRQQDVTAKARRDRAHAAISKRKAEQAYNDFVRQLRSSSYVNIRIPALREPSKQKNVATS